MKRKKLYFRDRSGKIKEFRKYAVKSERKREIATNAMRYFYIDYIYSFELLAFASPPVIFCHTRLSDAHAYIWVNKIRA